MISSKQVAKIMKRGEPVFLALIRPTSQSGQGMTQKAKQQIMKETGPIQKAPPVAETRKRMCNEAPADIRTELHDLLKEYADLFPEKLPKGRPPQREVEFEIKMEEGATPPSKPPYRLSPKEHEELQAQVDDSTRARTYPPVYESVWCPGTIRTEERWKMAHVCGLPSAQSTKPSEISIHCHVLTIC